MDKNTRGIVVGYDGSADADAALRWAADTAALEDLPLRAVMVDQVDASPWGGVYWEPDVGVVAQADLIIEKAGVRGSSELVTGHVVPVLIEAASDASLLVVGSQGHGRGGEILLGSVSQHLARQAKCPVVVVRQPAHPSADRIVVGVDGSGESAGALEFACRRAELTGEVVVAVHGWKAGNLLVGRDGQLPHDIGQKIEEKEVLLAESVAGVRAAHPDVTLVQEAIPVPAGQALVDASSNASLVVTGSRGRGAFAGMLLGSVSHDLVHRARCPVAIVR